MVKIQKVIYQNEHGESVTIDFSENDLGVEYIVDRVTDLVRDMAASGRDLGPPPGRKPEGEVPAWMGG
jgi:hypothetical protein